MESRRMTADDVPEEPPQYTAAHVRDWLADDDRLAVLDIRVRIMGRKVFLTGTVPTEARRGVVTDVVAAHLPDHEIHNEIGVVECPEASPAEVETIR
jgi:hypothetical protein